MPLRGDITATVGVMVRCWSAFHPAVGGRCVSVLWFSSGDALPASGMLAGALVRLAAPAACFTCSRRGGGRVGHRFSTNGVGFFEGQVAMLQNRERGRRRGGKGGLSELPQASDGETSVERCGGGGRQPQI